MFKTHRNNARRLRFSWTLLICLLSGVSLSHASDQVTVHVEHPSMEQRIGYPALIAPDGEYPSLQIESQIAGNLGAAIFNVESGARLQILGPLSIESGQKETLHPSGGLPPEGVYRIDVRMHDGESIVYYDSYYFSVLDTEALPDNYSRIAHPGPHGMMRYIPDVRGNRLPDFSGVGYREGEDIPHVPTVLTVGPKPGDTTQRLQEAIDQVSAREPDENGFRGALELEAGLYEVSDALYIRQSGVVLRGAGAGNIREFTFDPGLNLTLEQWREIMAGTTQTVLVATGPEHRPVLRIVGPSGIETESETETEILDTYVPVGRRWFHVANPEFFEVGDTIQLERRGNEAWISEIKMDQIPTRGVRQWEPFSLRYEATITAINRNRITINRGIFNAIEQRWGGGSIRRFHEGGRIRQSGVENLRAVSFFQVDEHGKDHTAHADQFVTFDRMRDGWARNIAAEHFTARTQGMFQPRRHSYGVTIENCSALATPRAFFEGEGYDRSGRTHQETGVYVGRYGFHFVGQNGLVRDCYAINNRHAYVVSSRVSGPNVFADSVAEKSLTYSEAHHRWSVAGLYENVEESHRIGLMNRLRFGTGHGWSAANYVAWNTRGGLVCEQPPTAQNWAIGHVGRHYDGPFHDWNMENFGWSYGYWESHGQHVTPASLYAQQLADRKAREANQHQ